MGTNQAIALEDREIPVLEPGHDMASVTAKISDIVSAIQSKAAPFYIPEARAYIVQYPKADLPAAKKVYSAVTYAGMEQGLVALYQRCVHLGCRVPWCQTSQWFECPCHGSKYSRVGSPVR